MKALKLLAGFIITVAVVSGGFVYSGAYDIGADEPHWTLTHTLVGTLRERSITLRIRNIEVPADLGEAARVRRGAGNYDAMCVACHLKPGMDDSEIRKGLYPQPPRLTQADADRSRGAGDLDTSAARQFWIIKHGIKASGMPAWSRGGVDDATIWDMVALLQKLPELSPADYAAAVAASAGHTHAGHHEHEDDDGHSH